METKQFIINWKSSSKHSAAQHLLYNLIRGKDARHGFTPIVGTSKIISNRCDAWNGWTQALNTLRSLYLPPALPGEASLAWQAGRRASFEHHLGMQDQELIARLLETLK